MSSEQPQAPPPPPHEGAAGEDVDDEECESEEEEEQFPITTETATAIRADGIAKFNKGEFTDALKLQHALLKFYTSTYGETDGKCAPYYLDYGITLLSIIQSSESEAAALAGNSGEENEDITLCHTVLELARVCYDKLEASTSDETEFKALQLRQAEVHEALSQVHHERDDDAEALKELEFALVLRQNASPANDRAIIGTLFEIGLLFLRNEEFEQAEARLTEAIDAAKQCPNLPPDMIEELQLHLDEAKELKEQGGLDNVKDEIRKLFPEDHSQGNPNGPSSSSGVSGGATMSLLSSVPAELASMTPSNNFGGIVPSRENSSSMSFFPRQVLGDATRGNSTHLELNDSTKVNTAVPVKRKERPRPLEGAASPEEKKHRAEVPNA